MIKKKKQQNTNGLSLNQIMLEQSKNILISSTSQHSLRSISLTKKIQQARRPLMVKNGNNCKQLQNCKSYFYHQKTPHLFKSEVNEEIDSEVVTDQQTVEQSQSKDSFFTEAAFQTAYSPVSKILPSQELFEQIQKLFSNQIRLKLIYQASENKFSINNFHESCSNIRNTLTICSITGGNIVGGFTPLKWDDLFQKQGTHYKSDFSERTFIFNLTTKQKFDLVKVSKNKAISCCNYMGPTFGGGYDFSIGNEANKKYTSSCNFPTSFYDSKQGLKLNRKSLIGINDEQFLIDQWQVFEVYFVKDHIRQSQSIKTQDYNKTQKLKRLLSKEKQPPNRNFGTAVEFLKTKFLTFISQNESLQAKSQSEQ